MGNKSEIGGSVHKEHVYLGKSFVNREDGRLPYDLIKLHWCREGRDKKVFTKQKNTS